MLLLHDPKIRLESHDATKPCISWWRSFGYLTIKNENNKFEGINGFISYLKCYHTVRYGSTSGTKHFIEHANKCFPLASTDSSVDDTHDQKLVQYKLSQVGFRKEAKLSLKEKSELKDLYAKWICKDLRPFTIVEGYGLQSLASMFINLGKRTDYSL